MRQGPGESIDDEQHGCAKKSGRLALARGRRAGPICAGAAAERRLHAWWRVVQVAAALLRCKKVMRCHCRDAAVDGQPNGAATWTAAIGRAAALDAQAEAQSGENGSIDCDLTLFCSPQPGGTFPRASRPAQQPKPLRHPLG